MDSFETSDKEILEKTPTFAVGRKELYKRFPLQYDLLSRREDHDGSFHTALFEIISSFLPDSCSFPLFYDAGCGTGKLSRHILGFYPKSRFISADRQLQMLRVVAPLQSCNPVLASTETSFLRPRSVDIVVAGWTLSETKGSNFIDWKTPVDTTIDEFEKIARYGVVICESLALGSDEPKRKGAHLYEYLIKERGYQQRIVKSDYVFNDKEEGIKLVRMFFGNKRVKELETKMIGMKEGKSEVRLQEWTALFYKKTS